ncbi:MAG: TonB-dependent receptor plug domain-containing protein [Chthoniobacteraceae bacterium]
MKLTRLLLATLAGLSWAGHAEDATPTTLPEIVITGKAEDLLGVTTSASKGQASAAEIQARPYGRRGEILEVVPGVIITQHAGGGKANQYFLRGFNLDHGTDFAIDIDGMPVNMRTHSHGQGYADLNILLPELVERVDYEKGVYAARNGDLSSAGAAHFKLYDYLPQGIASVTWGEHNYWRGLIADSFSAGAHAKLTLALEYTYVDGPWALPEQTSRWNGFARWFTGDSENHFSITAMGYRGVWQSSDQIPQRAIVGGRLDRFGYVDPRAGGDSQRYSLQLDWRRSEGGVAPEPGKAVGKSLIDKAPPVAPTIDDVWRANAYGFSYDLDLFSNFTYFLDDPERGDQFEQAEQRWTAGGEAAREWNNRQVFGVMSSFVLGVQTRHDWIDPIGLYKSEARQRFRTVREDSVYEGSVGLFAEATSHWTDWFRTTLGVRGDYFWFDVASGDWRNSGSDSRGLISPKFSAVFGPWKETELYLNAGTGFHSNDARGVNTARDPETGDSVQPVDPLVRTFGYEVGIRTHVVPKLTLTAAFWWLDNDSELVYVGDAGTNEPGPASRRYGVEVAAYYRPADWFTLDAEFAATHARFRDVGGLDRIPDSVPWMLNAGVTAGREHGPFGSIRARVFDQRPLVEDNSVKGSDSILFNGVIGYRTERWEVAVECLNIFDREDNDIEYFYTSRLPGEPDEGIDDIHLHPTEPRTFRVRGTLRF